MKSAIVVVPLVVLAACTSTQSQQGDLHQLSGAEMYQQLCASCHGTGGEGDGPVASLIRIQTPDLTRIAKRDGGEFPTEDVRRTIDGRYDRPAHGSRDMPVWGWRLYMSTSNDDPAERARVDSMIDRLVNYLKSIQKE
jgi:mono/diheme cytochrome c family protein